MMMTGGNLACVSCHGTNAQGGKHTMHMNEIDAPDIRWATLSSGHHEKGEQISTWIMILKLLKIPLKIEGILMEKNSKRKCPDGK